MKLSILIPVYNDRDFIEQAVNQIQAVKYPIPYEIIAVDDFSTDGSREILQRLKNVKVILHDHNTGKGGAIKTGLRYVSGDIIVVQDDDCEYDPTVIPSLISPILRGETSVVYGSRFLQQNQLYFIQRLENKAMTILTNILLGQRLTDVETGHKVFTKEVVKVLHLEKTGFEFDMEITLQILDHRFKIKELPTNYRARTHAEGKKITYRDGFKSLAMLFAYRLRGRRFARHK